MSVGFYLFGYKISIGFSFFLVLGSRLFRFYRILRVSYTAFFTFKLYIYLKKNTSFTLKHYLDTCRF